MEPGEARQITSIACVGEHIVWYGIWWAPGMVWYLLVWYGMIWHGMVWLPYYGYYGYHTMVYGEQTVWYSGEHMVWCSLV